MLCLAHVFVVIVGATRAAPAVEIEATGVEDGIVVSAQCPRAGAKCLANGRALQIAARLTECSGRGGGTSRIARILESHTSSYECELRKRRPAHRTSSRKFCWAKLCTSESARLKLPNERRALFAGNVASKALVCCAWCSPGVAEGTGNISTSESSGAAGDATGNRAAGADLLARTPSALDATVRRRSCSAAGACGDEDDEADSEAELEED